jgi:hypothetical protein
MTSAAVAAAVVASADEAARTLRACLLQGMAAAAAVVPPRTRSLPRTDRGGSRGCHRKQKGEAVRAGRETVEHQQPSLMDNWSMPPSDLFTDQLNMRLRCWCQAVFSLGLHDACLRSVA